MAEHNTLTGASLHENKGVDTASNNTVATATSNATVWKKISLANVDTTSILNVNQYRLNVRIDDLSTAQDVFVAVPVASTFDSGYSCLGAAINTADAIITIKDSTGAIVSDTTIPFTASAAGDTQSLAGSSYEYSAGSKIQISTDGASTGTAQVWLTLLFSQIE